MKEHNCLVIGLFMTVIVLSILIFASVNPRIHTMDEKRTAFIELKNTIQEELRSENGYRCCLEQPCTYCIEKSPGHGEGAVCDCLSDIVNGVHPCGECIGEILEGHGNPYLSEYFAEAIAEKVGKVHKDTLMQIIQEKYGIAIEDQK